MVFGHISRRRSVIGDIGPATRSLNLLTRLISGIRHKPPSGVDADVAFLDEAIAAGAHWRSFYQRRHQMWLDKGEPGIASGDLVTVADIDRVTACLEAIKKRIADVLEKAEP